MTERGVLPVNRRKLALGLASAPLLAAGSAAHEHLSIAPGKLRPFALGKVRLNDGLCRDAMTWNRNFMMRQDVDRLLHTFRLNAGLPSSAKPLGGWESPTCELRGHFVGHYMSACALMAASGNDAEFKRRGDMVVATLAECQKALNQDGYLSAFPISWFDRLDEGKPVWAPFYTLHKIMAGLYDMHVQTGSEQALQVLLGMADWTDRWCAAKSRPHMQEILEVEYGGMGEVLYNLAALTKNDRWTRAGDRFAKDKFFNPLAARHDELKGLHANTHIPQVIAAARRHEIAGDGRSHTIADFFWDSVIGGHAYATGGTSNKEFWLTEPRHLGAEWVQSEKHQECCCAYNLMKLTRHLFAWTGDVRYMDYYERVLFNHRIGTIEPETGRTMYHLSLTPSAWKVLCNDDATFWCCTGTGIEEYSKLGDSIYFHDRKGLYVNQFIASALDWSERGISVEQETAFPAESRTALIVRKAPGGVWPIHLRVPSWAKNPTMSVNGRAVTKAVTPGRYVTLARAWKPGDRIELSMPMTLRVAGFRDRTDVQALLFGPVVLAGQFAFNGPVPVSENYNDPDKAPPIEKAPMTIPKIALSGRSLADMALPSGKPLEFTLSGQAEPIALKPLYQSWQRYAVYWETA